MAQSILINGPQVIPADFLGTQSKWPQGGGTKPAGISLKAHRAHDTGNAWKWKDIEASAGVYTWTQVDACMTQWHTNGWNVVFNLYGTPTFYTSSVATDAYGQAGAAGYPDLDTNLTAWKAFVTALITRYNDPAGTWRLANPTLGKGIQYLETWNEPETSGSYWKGATGQFVDLCKAAYDSAKAVDSTLPIWCSGFLNVDKARQFFGVFGATLYTTTKYEQTFDHIAYHNYLTCPYGASYSNMYADALFSFSGAGPYLKLAALYKPSASVYCTEMGFASGSDANLNQFLAEPATFRYTFFGRILLGLAAIGVKGVYTYGWAWTFCGDFVNDTSGVVAAYNAVGALAGKTITAATQDCGGPITVTCSDGTTLTI